MGDSNTREEKESFAIQNINREEAVFGRSYLLGNRKGLAGLKNIKGR